MKWTCESCGECHENQFTSCWNCGLERDGQIHGGNFNRKEGASEKIRCNDVICSTTPFIPGREIAEIKGIVCGEAIMGANVFRDLVAGITDIVGGRSGVYETKLREGRSIALQDMKREAAELGAEAIVGVDIDYETVADTMLMISASGTAVILKSASVEEAAPSNP